MAVREGRIEVMANDHVRHSEGLQQGWHGGLVAVDQRRLELPDRGAEGGHITVVGTREGLDGRPREQRAGDLVNTVVPPSGRHLIEIVQGKYQGLASVGSGVQRGGELGPPRWKRDVGRRQHRTFVGDHLARPHGRGEPHGPDRQDGHGRGDDGAGGAGGPSYHTRRSLKRDGRQHRIDQHKHRPEFAHRLPQQPHPRHVLIQEQVGAREGGMQPLP